MKIILCDIDGVILDFICGFANWMKINYDLTVSHNPNKWIPDFENSDYFIKLYLHHNPHLPLLDPRIPQQFAIWRKTYKIILITKHPEKVHRAINLHYYNIQYDGIFHTNDKLAVAALLKPSIIFEDKPDTILKLLTSGFIVASPRWNYNSHIKHNRFIQYDKITEINLLELLN